MSSASLGTLTLGNMYSPAVLAFAATDQRELRENFSGLYPYVQPGTIIANDFSWLEHALLFFYKQPSDFGAKLWNGVYYQLKPTDKGLVGEPQALDIGLIGVPPENLDVPRLLLTNAAR